MLLTYPVISSIESKIVLTRLQQFFLTDYWMFEKEITAWSKKPIETYLPQSQPKLLTVKQYISTWHIYNNWQMMLICLMWTLHYMSALQLLLTNFSGTTLYHSKMLWSIWETFILRKKILRYEKQFILYRNRQACLPCDRSRTRQHTPVFV